MTPVGYRDEALTGLTLGQVALSVRNVERATAFYRDVLGLEHLFSAPPGLSFFRTGGVRLMLARPEAADAPVRSAVAPRPPEPAAPTGTTLYCRVPAVPAVHAAHAQLAARGTRAVTEPHVVHWSETSEPWMGFFDAGEGNLFAVMGEVAATVHT